MVGLLLHQEGRLTTPLLYLSGHLEAHRREYYERLQAVRARGEGQQFFLTAVQRRTVDGVDLGLTTGASDSPTARRREPAALTFALGSVRLLTESKT